MKLKSKDYVFVSIQLGLFLVYILHFDLAPFDGNILIRIISIIMIILGVLVALIAVLQLNTKLSPFPSPKANTIFITYGVYKYVRHPIYTGILLITFGYGLYLTSIYKIIISILLYTLFYFKSSYEENRLKIAFSDYESYQKKSGRFFPKNLIK